MTLFNSRNSIHRSPLGAVADGTRVHFKITLPRDMQCSASYLLVQHPDNRIECLDMFLKRTSAARRAPVHVKTGS